MRRGLGLVLASIVGCSASPGEIEEVGSGSSADTMTSSSALSTLNPGTIPATLTRRIVGVVRCRAPNDAGTVTNALGELPVSLGGLGSGKTDSTGRFSIAVASFPAGKINVKATYDGPITNAGASSRLLVMNDFHNARSEDVSRSQVSANAFQVDVGTITLSSVDCEMWRIGRLVLRDFHTTRRASPPAKELRIKRWEGVIVGTPYAYYDYVNIRTDFTSAKENAWQREHTLFHEFAHSVRHVADGDEAHWHWDNFRWAYARHHDGTEVANVQYAFNEGWADYWAQARYNSRAAYSSKLAPGFRDWNEHLVANRLLELSALSDVNDRVMVQVLEANPGQIHSLNDFENRLMDRLGRRRPSAPASCPPGYTDDGATCRLDVHVYSKPSYGRGVGTTPTACGTGRELDAGLCYDKCNSGYNGVGPVCWQKCPAGYNDDGAFCRRDVKIIWSDNSACPGYDLCGLTFAKGCSVCPPGYQIDGCTCRIDAHVFAKSSYGRGVGTVPTACSGSNQYDAGLCYTPCSAGYTGVGPVCWGSCAADYEDHGATCHRGTHIIVK